MTTFLFLQPSETGGARRVDFASINRRFAEPDETQVMPPRFNRLGAILIATIIVLCTIGDTILVARPDILAHGFANLQTRSISKVAML